MRLTAMFVKKEALVFITLSGLSFLFFSCGKESQQQPIGTEIRLTISHESMEKALNRDSIFLDSAGNRLRLSKFEYLLSNFHLMAEDPKNDFQVSDAIFLVKGLENDGRDTLILKNIPPGKYRGIKIGIGLDPVTNKSGPGTGALDPGNGMFWPWSDEYKFMVLEGTYTTKLPEAASGSFLFHIAGNPCYKQVFIPFGLMNDPALNFQSRTELKLKCELSALFGRPNPIDFRVTNNVMSPEAGGTALAGNYAPGGFLRFKGISAGN
jgi:hypothetical protein